MKFQIAIDGISSSGKSTIAKAVSEKLNFSYLNTGIYFRLFAYVFNKYDFFDVFSLIEFIEKSIVFKNNKAYLNGIDITKFLFDESINSMVGDIASVGIIRDVILKYELKEAEKGSIVMEGRDICTSILPNAHLKIFLTAPLEIRAERRHKQMKETINLEIIKKSMISRDCIDKGKCKIEDLGKEIITIDTHEKSIEEIRDLIIDLFQTKVNLLVN